MSNEAVYSFKGLLSKYTNIEMIMSFDRLVDLILSKVNYKEVSSGANCTKNSSLTAQINQEVQLLRYTIYACNKIEELIEALAVCQASIKYATFEADADKGERFFAIQNIAKSLPNQHRKLFNEKYYHISKALFDAKFSGEDSRKGRNFIQYLKEKSRLESALKEYPAKKSIGINILVFKQELIDKFLNPNFTVEYSEENKEFVIENKNSSSNAAEASESAEAEASNAHKLKAEKVFRLFKVNLEQWAKYKLKALDSSVRQRNKKLLTAACMGLLSSVVAPLGVLAPSFLMGIMTQLECGPLIPAVFGLGMGYKFVEDLPIYQCVDKLDINSTSCVTSYNKKQMLLDTSSKPHNFREFNSGLYYLDLRVRYLLLLGGVCGKPNNEKTQLFSNINYDVFENIVEFLFDKNILEDFADKFDLPLPHQAIRKKLSFS